MRLALLTALFVPAVAEAAPVIAIFELEDTRAKNERFSDAKRADLTGYLASLLARDGAFRVVPTAQLQGALLEAKKETYKSCYDERCQIEIGKAVAAEKTVSVRIIKIGGLCAVTASLYDLRNEATENSASEKTKCTEDPIVAALETVASVLRRGNTAASPPPPPPPPSKEIRFDTSTLPVVPEVAVPEAIDEHAKGLDFGSVDVEQLAIYDEAIKAEKDSAATPEAKIAKWEGVKEKAPTFAKTAEQRIADWRAHLAAKAAAEKAVAQRKEKLNADFAKLKRLFGLGVVSEEDKGEWAIAFLEAYGAYETVNERANDEDLKTWAEKGYRRRATKPGARLEDQIRAWSKMSAYYSLAHEKRKEAYDQATKTALEFSRTRTVAPRSISKRLASGFEIHVSRDSSDRATVALVSRCGAAQQSEAENGAAWVVDRVLRDRPLALRDPLYETSADNQTISGSVEVGRLPQAIASLADAIAQTRISSARFEAARREELSSLEWRTAGSPADTLRPRSYFRAEETPKLGDLDRLDLSHVQRFFERCWVTPNSALFVSGNVDPNQVFALAETAFKKWPAGKPVEIEKDPNDTASKSGIVFHANRNLDANGPIWISLVFLGPSFAESPEETYVADLLTMSLVADGSRFQKTIGNTGFAHYSTEAQRGPITLMLRLDGTKDWEAGLQRLRNAISRAAIDMLTVDVELGQRRLAYEWFVALYENAARAGPHWWAIRGLDEFDAYDKKVLAIDSKKAFPPFLEKYIWGKPFVVQITVPGPLQDKLRLDVHRMSPKLLEPIKPAR
jgi:hypothetical protein